VKIIEKGKPDVNNKEVEETPLIKAKNPPCIHLTDENIFVEKQLGMCRK